MAELTRLQRINQFLRDEGITKLEVGNIIAEVDDRACDICGITTPGLRHRAIGVGQTHPTPRFDLCDDCASTYEEARFRTRERARRRR